MDAHLAFTFAQNRRLHLGVCGSVAAYRGPDLVRMWHDAGIHVSATLTPSAARFITPLTFEALGASPVYGDMFGEAKGMGPFDHLEPGQTSHAMVIAPASADTIARLANGMADTMLSCQALAFRTPLVIAPAMNPAMWHNAATQANIATLRARGHSIIEPACGRTACLEEGQGRLADLRLIYAHGLRALAPQDMAGQKVMVTLGPTQERWDGVRYWTNPSTGIMGASLAMAAWLRGAEVHAICGPKTPWLPEGAVSAGQSQSGSSPDASALKGPSLIRYNVSSANEMFAVAQSIWQNMNVGIFTAAVADFSPVPHGAEKFKKDSVAPRAEAQAQENTCDSAHGNEARNKVSASDAHNDGGFAIRFTPNRDILATLGNAKQAGQKVVGFAAETSNLFASMQGKLQRKNADMIVGNLVGGPHAGFGSASNVVHILDAKGMSRELEQQSKPDVAWSILSWLLDL